MKRHVPTEAYCYNKMIGSKVLSHTFIFINMNIMQITFFIVQIYSLFHHTFTPDSLLLDEYADMQIYSSLLENKSQNTARDALYFLGKAI